MIQNTRKSDIQKEISYKIFAKAVISIKGWKKNLYVFDSFIKSSYFIISLWGDDGVYKKKTFE